MEEAFTDHIVIIHWDRFAELIVEQLRNAGKHVFIVTDKNSDKETITDNYDPDIVQILVTQYSDFARLKQANIQQSSAVFVNIPDDTEKLAYLINLRNMFPDLRYIVSIDNEDLKETFYNSGVYYCISKTEISAKMVSSFLFENDVAEYSNDLIAASETDEEYDIRQYKVIPGNPVIGKQYSECFKYIRQQYNGLLIGLSRNRKLMKLPPKETEVKEGDYIMVIMNAKEAQALSSDFGVQEGY